MNITIEQIEQRIHFGWDKFPTPRPYISVKRETYTKLKALAIFVDEEFGEWEALADGVMRGGMHPKRRQGDHSPVTISKEDFYELYITQNLPVSDIAHRLGCHKAKILGKINEFDLKKPMALKLKLMARTNQERYGCDFVSQNPEFSKKAHANRDKEKIKAAYKTTMLDRYGVENGFSSKEIMVRAKQTMVRIFGTPHALKSEICKDKYRKTIREKYDDISLVWAGLNVKEIRDKVTTTNKKKLGVDFPFQSDEIQEKVIKTFIERYGVDRIAKSPAIQNKIRESILKRFGIHHLSLPEIRERIKQTSLERYGCVCSLQNPEVAQKSYETKLQNDSFNTSTAEKEIRQFVQSLFPNIRYNVRDIIPPYELDIVIPEKNIAIEYNGLYWHSEAWHDKNYHALKLKLCKEAGYRLIMIFENEWYGRQTAVKSRIRAILGCNKYTVGARETEFSAASSKEVLPFLRDFHIQGGARFENAFKLTIDGLIVAVMTFARHHRQNSKMLVLNRFCVREDYSIIGGAAKLLKNANIKEPIISYSDNRWSEGDIYQRLNFKSEEQIPPDYFYISNSGVFSKQSMKKTKEERLLGKSEHELRLEQGYLRVYDCGKQRWRLEAF